MASKRNKPWNNKNYSVLGDGVCRYCGETVQWVMENGRKLPLQDGKPHWPSCRRPIKETPKPFPIYAIECQWKSAFVNCKIQPEGWQCGVCFRFIPTIIGFKCECGAEVVRILYEDPASIKTPRSYISEVAGFKEEDMKKVFDMGKDLSNTPLYKFGFEGPKPSFPFILEYRLRELLGDDYYKIGLDPAAPNPEPIKIDSNYDVKKVFDEKMSNWSDKEIWDNLQPGGKIPVETYPMVPNDRIIVNKPRILGISDMLAGSMYTLDGNRVVLKTPDGFKKPEPEKLLPTKRMYNFEEE